MAVILLFNGLTLALALGLLTLILWHDPNSEANRYYALFLLMMVIWASGSLLGRAAAYVNAGESTIQTGLRLLDIGFSGANLSIYIYSVVITGVQGRLFRVISLIGLVVVFAYHLLLLFSNAPRAFSINDNGVLVYNFNQPSAILYTTLLLGTMLMVWRNRLKIHDQPLIVGILLFATGQILALFSPRFRMAGVSESVSTLATLMMSYAVVRRQIMVPLLGRAKQLEAVRDVGLAITSRLHLQDTLSAIAAQAVGLLDADGAAIFLKGQKTLKLAAVYNLPRQYVGLEIPIGEGVVGTVAREQRGRRVDHYHRDWKGKSDLPLARETFGAVASVPLIFAGEVVGVLLVIQGRQGRLFGREDMHLLELLGPQAAVAITNSRLFEAERGLSNDLAIAKNQLEIVLTSTENPVVAIDRSQRIIFANPAAVQLLDIKDTSPIGQRIREVVPPTYLPSNLRRALRILRQQHVYVYEIAANQSTFLCHVAELEREGTGGWVVVLNDITQLKELDRLKSQMVQMTSHDLKNPLQAAMSYVELLAEDGQDILTNDMHDYISMIWTQLTRMFRLINGILDLERAQTGIRVREECVMEDVIGRAVVDMADQARSKQITLQLEIKEKLPPVLGDPQQLCQAFANLVDNAIKFTPSGGEVVVRASFTRKHVLVDVADKGVGIPLEDQTNIFERFYRGKQQGHVHVGGTGLGLSLVKAIITGHQGEINFESTPGEGTTFHIRLPAMDERGSA